MQLGSGPEQGTQGVVARGVAADGHVNPQHAEGLQQARGAQSARVHGLKAEIGDATHHHRLARRIVAGHEHHGRRNVTGRVRHHLEPDLVEGLEHRGTRRERRHMFGARAVETDRQLQTGCTHPQRVRHVDHQAAGEITRGGQRVADGVEGYGEHDRIGPLHRSRH